jgi:hypothetical protein
MNVLVTEDSLPCPRLAARVAAVNACHARALQLHALIMERVGILTGKKVVRADGSIAENLKKLVVPFLTWDAMTQERIYAQGDYLYGSVRLSLKPTPGESITTVERSFQAARLDDGRLTAGMATPQLRTDYDAAEIRRLRRDYQHKKELARDAFEALHPFGAYDS